MFVFFYRYCNHRDRHVLTHSCPTRRSSDLCSSSSPSISARIVLTTRSVTCGSPRPPPRAGTRLSSSSMKMTVGATCRAGSEEHTSELQSLMRISYAVFCLKKKNIPQKVHVTQLI